jgi:PAS domain-containing protein
MHSGQPPSSTTALKRGNWVAFIGSVAFIGWIVAYRLGVHAFADVIDFIFFLPLGLVVGAIQLQVAGRIDDRRDRLAWQLLAAASFARWFSGNIWSALVLSGVSRMPTWIVPLASLYLLLGNGALLAFRGADLRRTDERRFVLDGLIVLVGSFLVTWFFAIVPLLNKGGGALTRDYIYTAGDSIAVVLAAALYLRARTAITRDAAAFLVIAYILQVVPDVYLTSANLSAYQSGNWIETVWFAVWGAKWLGARRALHQLDRARDASLRPFAEYRGGLLPYGFVVASAVLLYAMLNPSDSMRGSQLLFLFGSGSIAMLLVARQFLELGERDRLHSRMLAESDWFRTVLAHAFDFLALINRDGRAVYLSPTTERLLDVAPAAEPPSVFDVLDAHDAEQLRALITDAQFATTMVDVRLRGADHRWRDITLRVQDMRHEVLVNAVVLNGHDVTREGELARRLRESQEVEALGVFAGGLAHDLNNFLTVIVAHVDLLCREVPSSRVRAHADLRTMQETSMRAAALTSGLLTLSRRKSDVREIVDLGALLRERLDALGAAVDGDDIAAHVSVRVEPTALRHTVDALLSEQFAAQRDGAPPCVTLRTNTLASEESAALELDPGTYAVLRIGADRGGSDAALKIPRPTANWEIAPDDLGALLVHAALREFGGGLAIDARSRPPRVAMYLPSSS